MAACDSNLNTETEQGSTTPPNDLPIIGSAGQASNDLLTLEIGDGVFELEEGTTLNLPITVTRLSNSESTIQLSASLQSDTDTENFSWSFSDANLGSNETSSSLALSLAIDTFPIQAQTRTLLVTAADSDTALLKTAIDIEIQPTSFPDIYLLVGQSNMVGFSEDNSKQANVGELDAPSERIKQLNVTGNDEQNFATEGDFTDTTKLYNTSFPLSPALDPLHNGFDPNSNSKFGQRIGLGLTFAKQALNDTSSTIYLVPTAWSDTGFCKRNTNRLPGIGWNTTVRSDEAFSGTLLYERAVARTNATLSQTNGILRGILWHQGEADSDNAICAEAYADNLTELATALRSNIDTDARGIIARGADSDVPFIVGTLSKGSDDRGSQLPFSDSKLLVDNALRNITSLIPQSNVVNNDDLIPPNYPCGEGSCIHFGAAAFREMGVRYYNALTELKP